MNINETVIFIHIYMPSQKHIHRHMYKYISTDILTRLPILSLFTCKTKVCHFQNTEPNDSSNEKIARKQQQQQYQNNVFLSQKRGWFQQSTMGRVVAVALAVASIAVYTSSNVSVAESTLEKVDGAVSALEEVLRQKAVAINDLKARLDAQVTRLVSSRLCPSTAGCSPPPPPPPPPPLPPPSMSSIVVCLLLS